MMPFALKIALREIRHGIHGFGIFLTCLVLGVSMIAAVGIVSTAINEALSQQSRALLGGDVEIVNNQEELSKEIQSFITAHGDVSLSIELRAMGRSSQKVSLVELKSVDSAYPLTGEMVLQPEMPLADALKNHGIVMDESAMLRMGINVGDTVSIGTITFTLRAKILKEPDRVVNTFSFGPRILMSEVSLREAGLLLPGSLVKYRYRVLLHEMGYKEFLKKLEAAYPKQTWQLRNYNQAAESLEGVIDRFRMFLTLTALSAMLIGGIGISGAVSRYLQSKSETIATLKSLGATRRTIFSAYLLVVLLVGSAGIATGLVLSLLFASLAIPYVGHFIPVATAAIAYPEPLALAALFGFLTIFTFSLYALGRAADVKPALLFRGGLTDYSKVRVSIIAANYAIVVLFVMLTVWTAEDKGMALLFIQIAVACICVFWGCGQIVVTTARRIRPRRAWLRLAVANLHRPGSSTVATMLAIGVGLSILIMLLVVQGNISRQVTEVIPAKAPSLFMIDVQPEQKPEFLKALQSFAGVSDPVYTPMVRGRVVAIAGVPVEKAKIEKSARWVTRGDRGLTYSAKPLPNNRIVEGKWWPEDYRGKPLLSLDKRVADGMHVGIGDTVTVNAGGKTVTAEIANLREVNYSTLQINFAMMLSPGAIDDLPHTFVVTAHVVDTATEVAVIQSLATSFPNVSIIQVSSILEQLNEVMGYVSLALTLMISLTLIMGIMVLAGALAATQEKRAYDTVILKVLGARRRDIIKVYMTEWALLAFITSLVAIGLGELFAWETIRRFRQTEFSFMPWVVLGNIVMTLVIVTLLGFLGNLRAFHAKPAAMLRNE